MAIFLPLQAFDSQTPTDDLDNEFIFECFPLGDTIVSANVTVSPPGGLTVTDQLIVDNTVTAWATGGIAGTTYTLTCTVVTENQRTAARSGALPIVAFK